MKIEKTLIDDRRKLKAMLVLCGIKVTDIAREKGVAQATVSNVIAGRRSYPIEKAIAEKLGVSYEALWGNKPKFIRKAA